MTLILPVFSAFVISFFTSMAGVSGAFALLPFQISLMGVAGPTASATNHLFNVLAIPGGIFRYYREGRLLWQVSAIIFLGSAPGVLIGVWIRTFWLPDAARFRVFAGAILILIGVRLLHDVVSRVGEPEFSSGEGGVADLSLNVHRGSFCFHNERFEFSLPALIIWSVAVGMVGGIYGIGGGAFMAPILVGLFRLPIHCVAGASLLATFLTSLTGVVGYQGIAAFAPGISAKPDWALGILLAIGGAAGMYSGSRCQKYVPSRLIKLILCLSVLAVGLGYLLRSAP